jgi:hypothetical protein
VLDRNSLLLELVAYINISRGSSRREHSKCCDSNVHGAGVYWPIGVIKFAGGRLGCGRMGATPPRYGTGVRGILGIPYSPVLNPYKSVRNPYA